MTESLNFRGMCWLEISRSIGEDSAGRAISFPILGDAKPPVAADANWPVIDYPACDSPASEANQQKTYKSDSSRLDEAQRKIVWWNIHFEERLLSGVGWVAQKITLLLKLKTSLSYLIHYNFFFNTMERFCH